MKSRQRHLQVLLDEATRRFVGRGSVLGVAIGGDTDLTVLLAEPDPVQERAVRSWADRNSVSLGFMVTGRFFAGGV